MGPLLSYKWSYFPLQVGLSPHLPINFWPFIRAPFYHTYNARLGAHLGLLEVQSTSQQRGGTFNSDSDWAGCLETRRSTDCQLVMVAGGVVQVTAQPSQVCGENHFQRHEGQWHRQYQSRLKLQGLSASKTQWAYTLGTLAGDWPMALLARARIGLAMHAAAGSLNQPKTFHPPSDLLLMDMSLIFQFLIYLEPLAPSCQYVR